MLVAKCQKNLSANFRQLHLTNVLYDEHRLGSIRKLYVDLVLNKHFFLILSDSPQTIFNL